MSNYIAYGTKDGIGIISIEKSSTTNGPNSLKQLYFAEIGNVEVINIHETGGVCFFSGTREGFTENEVCTWNVAEKSYLKNDSGNVTGKITFSSKVLAIKSSNEWLAVLLKDSIQLIYLTDEKMIPREIKIDTIDEGKAFPFCFGSNNILGFQKNNSTYFMKIEYQKNTSPSSPHDFCGTPFCISVDGTTVAVLSNDGCNVHVKTPTQQLVLKRGRAAAKVYDVSLNVTSTTLLVSSNRGTCHVFSLKTERPSSGYSYFPFSQNFIGSQQHLTLKPQGGKEWRFCSWFDDSGDKVNFLVSNGHYYEGNLSNGTITEYPIKTSL